MNHPVRTALLSHWHVHARDYARQAAEHPDTEIVAVWDEDPDRGAAQSDVMGVPFQADLDELLARDDLDAVIVTTPTSAHRDVMLAALRAGKHVFTEKVLALTSAEVDEILAEAEKQGVALTVSLPRLSDPYTLAARRLVEEGALGELTEVRVRLSHNGAVGAGWLPDHFYDPATTGGGAMMDLGAHPMYLCRLLLGRLPETVSASFGFVTGRAVDDNAVALLRRDDGAIAVAEVAFVNRFSPFTLEVHGTEGSLLYGTPEPRMLLRTSTDPAHTDWRAVALPERAPMPFQQWVEHIRTGSRGAENLALAKDLTVLMEAAYRAGATGTETKIADLTGSA